MRYWIWWNDLIQGPFELDELTSLKAFSEDLLVCMEDREDWLPAGRVADLSSAIEQYRARWAVPRVPPPPPPKRPPTTTPLQGEFFADPPNQEQLLDTDEGPKGPFAYRPVTGDFEAPPATYLEGRVTMPFHFARQPNGLAAVIELPRPEPPRIHMASSAVTRESPIHEEDLAPAVPLEELLEEPVPVQEIPALSSPYDEFSTNKKLAWLPWILGVALALGALGSLGYWLVDRASTHSAIAEAKRLEAFKAEYQSKYQTPPPSVPIASPLPVVQRPASPLPLDAGVSNSPSVVKKWPAKIKSTLSSWAAGAHNLLSRLKNITHSATNTSVAVPEAAVPAATSAQASPYSNVRPTAAGRSRVPSAVSKAARLAVAKSKRAAAAARKKLARHTSAAAPSAPSVPTTASVPMVPSATTAEAPVAVLPGVAPAPVTPDTISAPPSPAPAEPPAVNNKPAPVDLPPSEKASAANPWKGKQNEAIAVVQNKKLPKSKATIGSQARTMLLQMHEKELLHAAETGERLYLPDKLVWTALQEEGPVYRVYLNFMAWQLNGERVQSRSYQFEADLKHNTVKPMDTATQQDLLGASLDLTFKHNPMATDIESILGGVDTYNKHKVQLIIIKKSRRNRDDRKKIESAMAAAQNKVQRAVVYFRKTYAAKALENLAKAYEFSDMLKG